MGNTTAEVAARYVRERRQRQEVRPGSLRTIRHTLNTFLDSAGWDLPVSKIRKSHVEKWLGRRELGPASRRAQLSIVRTWCRWMVDNDLMMRDPTSGIRAPKQPRYLPRGLKLAQVQAILEAADGPRERLVVLLMCQEGLRCCEIVGLEVGDVDLDDGVLLVRAGKGGHQRMLPLTDETAEAVETYRRTMPRRAGPLVRPEDGSDRHLSSKYLSRLVALLMRDAGVEATAHALRHTAATDMLRAGAHIRDVQQALGHLSLETTQRYMPLVVNDLRKAMGGRRYAKPKTLPKRRAVDGPDDAA